MEGEANGGEGKAKMELTVRRDPRSPQGRWQCNEKIGEGGILVSIAVKKITNCYIELIVNENPVVLKKERGQSDAMRK